MVARFAPHDTAHLIELMGGNVSYARLQYLCEMMMHGAPTENVRDAVGPFLRCEFSRFSCLVSIHRQPGRILPGGK